MVYSMTAFARRQQQSEQGVWIWEVRSINHRYLDCHVYLPNGFVAVEAQVRQSIRQQLQRGRVDAKLYFRPEQSQVLQVNQDLAQTLLQACHTMAAGSPCHTQVNLMDVLTYPDVLYWQEQALRAMSDDILALLHEVLDDVMMMRQREGAALQQGLQQRLQRLREFVSKIPTLYAHGQQVREQRFAQFMAEFEMAVEEKPLEQAVVSYLQKFDIAEELDRLTSHIAAVEDSLSQAGAVGRRLDFLMQEMHREVNTLAAKSIDVEISEMAIEMKVLMEQMREQSQNIL